MADRQVDATRAGQDESNASHRVSAVVHPPMSVDDALAHADSIDWKHFKSKGDRALISLAAAVRHLRIEQRNSDLSRRVLLGMLQRAEAAQKRHAEAADAPE